ALEPAFLRNYHPSSLRWVLLDRYLSEHHARYGRVLMVDVRDTIFQSNPFSLVSGTGLHVFRGIEDRTIGKCGWNGGWVRDCYGDAALKRVADRPILCSGVSAGMAANAKAYVAAMAKQLLSEPLQRCERNGVDQGVHNYLIHIGAIPDVQTFGQESGPVANMQMYKLAGSSKDGSIPVVQNRAGKAVVVAHQYDRNKAFMAQVFAKY
ncbi:unnamed protein product, partial [Phaeothamnion confervicola]